MKVVALCLGGDSSLTPRVINRLIEEGYEVVISADVADVVIVRWRLKVFDYLEGGKVVVQLITGDDDPESARDLLLFERFRNRLFICRRVPGAPDDGLGEVFETLAKIWLAMINSAPQPTDRKEER